MSSANKQKKEYRSCPGFSQERIGALSLIIINDVKQCLQIADKPVMCGLEHI
jgi:hypothetical protein